MSQYDAALAYLRALQGNHKPSAEEHRLSKILSVIPHNRNLQAKEIAKLVGRKNSARLRSELSTLCKRGLIRRAHHQWGYIRISSDNGVSSP